jgi:hypothetical protein
MSKKLEDLNQFTGTTRYYKHWSGCLVYTDGVHYLAEEGGAHWLIDAVASYQLHPTVKADESLQEFQLWHLKRDDQGGATLTVLRDSNEPVLDQHIDFTDFPLDEIKLYLTDGVLLLTSEY